MCNRLDLQTYNWRHLFHKYVDWDTCERKTQKKLQNGPVRQHMHDFLEIVCDLRGVWMPNNKFVYLTTLNKKILWKKEYRPWLESKYEGSNRYAHNLSLSRLCPMFYRRKIIDGKVFDYVKLMMGSLSYWHKCFTTIAIRIRTSNKHSFTQCGACQLGDRRFREVM